MSMTTEELVILCAGHHEGAQGAVSPHFGFTEYEEAVKICKEAHRMAKNRSDFNLVLKCGRLREKVAYINGKRPLLAVDLHFNADADHTDPHDEDSSRGKGTMVMYYPNSDEGRRIASRASAAMSAYLSTVDRGAREGWYWGGDNPGTVPDYFLAKTVCKALIFEPFYIDNRHEAEYWLHRGRHRQVAEAVLDGIAEAVRALQGG